ncbi:UNKNOWN [Stylonychia lemnae]|uniref:Protein nlrc3 n=1 Tax=Stylonychia lemnae TaxID=5949 RepID=A0A078AFV5_STYLE|nr:UNKNOWN [Stylonychia lemnae]|eukprot:CDW81109.1 UNKNOWN [Stylonychia lemnae]
MKESQLCLRGLSKFGQSISERLAESYHGQDDKGFYEKIEVVEDFDIVKLNERLLNKKVIQLQINLCLFLRLKDNPQELEIFRTLTALDSVRILRFQNTSSYSYTMINKELDNWEVHTSINKILLENNKFKVKQADRFLKKVVSLRSITNLQLVGCLFNSQNFQILIDELANNNESLRSLTISCLRFFQELETDKNHQKQMLDNLANSIKGQRYLKTLKLNQNEGCIDFLKSVIANNNTVQKLSLSQCDLRDNNFLLLLEAFLQNQTLQSIDLSHNKLKAQSGRHLKDIIASNPVNLQSLILNNNELDDRGFSYVLEGMDASQSQLINLDVSQNHIRFENSLLTQSLISICKRKHLKNLILSHNAITPLGCEKLLQLHEQMGNRLFDALHLDTNKHIKDDGAVIISQIIEKSLQIRHVGLINCEISDRGGQVIANSLSKNESLFSLHLGFNPISCETVERMSDSLKVNQTLKILQMHFCSIGERGALSLASSLQVNSRLTRLILKANPIGNKGCQAILTSLKFNHSLIVINLEDCGLLQLDEGVCEALSVNKTLEVLWICNNQLGEGTGKVMAQVLENNSMLKIINLQGNFLNDKDAEELFYGLRKNTTCRHLSLNTNSFSDQGKKLLNDEKKNHLINRSRLIF